MEILDSPKTPILSTERSGKWDYDINEVDNISLQSYNENSTTTIILDSGKPNYQKLGGGFQCEVPLGIDQEYTIFSYYVPMGKVLIIKGIFIDSISYGSKTDNTPILLQWGLGVGDDNDKISLTENLLPKITSSTILGFQNFYGEGFVTQPKRIDRKFGHHIVIKPNEYLCIQLKVILGDQTFNQIIRGVVGVDGYFNKLEG